MRKGYAVAGGLALLLVLYALVPWEWGLMDDPAFYGQLHSAIATRGLLGGMVANFLNLAHADVAWGLFRPSWWAYASTFYLFEPRVVYVLRLLMLFGIFVFPMLALRRSSKAGLASLLALILLAADRPIFDGLQFVSLQEYSGCLLVAFGVWLGFGKASSARDAGAAACFLLAAWFKAPFVWLLLFHAGFLVMKKKRVALGGTVAAVALATLLVVVRWAAHGSYTSRLHASLAASAVTTVLGSLRAGACLLVVGALLLFFLRKKLPKLKFGRPGVWDERMWLAAVFGAAGALYLLNLLPWGASGYYLMAPLFLGTIGALFFMHAHADVFLDARVLTGAKLAVLALVASVSLVKGFGEAYLGNEAIRFARDWALTIPQHGVLLGTSRLEAADRFEKVMQMRTDGDWRDKVVFVPWQSTFPAGMKYFICFTKDACPRLDGVPTVAEQARVSIHRLH